MNQTLTCVGPNLRVTLDLCSSRLDLHRSKLNDGVFQKRRQNLKQSMLGPGPDSCLRMSGNNMLCFKGSKAKFSVTVTMKDPVVL